MLLKQVLFELYALRGRQERTAPLKVFTLDKNSRDDRTEAKMSFRTEEQIRNMSYG